MKPCGCDINEYLLIMLQAFANSLLVPYLEGLCQFCHVIRHRQVHNSFIFRIEEVLAYYSSLNLIFSISYQNSNHVTRATSLWSPIDNIFFNFFAQNFMISWEQCMPQKLIIPMISWDCPMM